MYHNNIRRDNGLFWNENLIVVGQVLIVCFNDCVLDKKAKLPSWGGDAPTDRSVL